MLPKKAFLMMIPSLFQGRLQMILSTNVAMVRQGTKPMTEGFWLHSPSIPVITPFPVTAKLLES
jgi:hypothetical protein